MNTGSLRNKAIIQSAGTAQNEFGEVEEGEFETFKTVWCSIVPIKGNESFLSDTNFSKTTHKIRIRYLAGVNASMRLLWQGRYFNFINTKNVGERFKQIEILAWEDNND